MASSIVRLIGIAIVLLSMAAQGECQESALAADPEHRRGSYFVQQFSAPDELPSGYISAIHQDRRGFLWLGTAEGLTRSDGRLLTTFDRRNTTSFRSHNVAAIAEAEDGSLWIGTGGGGLQRYFKGRIHATDIALPHSEVTTLHLAPSGALWIGCRGALCRLRGDKLRCFDTDDGLPSQWISGALSAPGDQAIATDSAGRVWVATPDGTVVAEEAAGEPRFDLVATGDSRPVALYTDPSGALWSGTDRGVIGRLDGDGFHPVVDLGDSIVISALAMQDDGTLWAGTISHGLARWHPKDRQVHWLTEAEGLPSGNILSMATDREQNLWVGTGLALARVARGLISQLGESNGLAGHTVVGLAEGRSGTWVVTDEGGLSRYRQDRFTPIEMSPPLDSQHLRRVFETRSGEIWLGTRRGLDRLVDGKRLAGPSNLIDQTISAILEDRAGRLWIGTATDGVHVRDAVDGSWHHLSVATGLPSPSVYTLAEGSKGELWVGTRQGLGRIELQETSATVDSFGPAEGLDEPLVVALHAGADGTLWIGTVSYGLVRYRDGVFESVSEQHGLPDATVWAILEDAAGDFWLSSNRGISHVKGADLESFFAGTNRKLLAVRYGPSEGLLKPDCVGGFLSAGIETTDGALAFATTAGVAFIHQPELAAAPQAPPAVYVLRAEIDGQPQDLSKQIRVAAGSRRIELLLGAPTHKSPQHVKLRARLLGFSPDWEPVDRQRHLTYTNLAPCHCRLEVETSRDGMTWQTAGQTSIVVEPHWHQRPMVRAFGLSLLLVVIPGMLRLRLWQAAKRERRLRRRVAERTESLRLANEELADANSRLFDLSMIDALTGLSNRRRFDEALEQEWRRAERHHDSLALLLIDLDRFKDLNDQLGHAAGDEALRNVASIIREWARRAEDLAARIGGDELSLLMPTAERDSAEQVAESIRAQIAAYAKDHGRDGFEVLSVSIGVAVTVPSSDSSATAFLALADRALYRAKSLGRNRVVVETDLD